MKISVSTYSFDRLKEQGLIDIIAKAKEMGFDGVEITQLEPESGRDRIDYAREVREACERHGLPVVSYTVAADFISGRDGAENMNEEAERLFKEVDIAEILGAAAMRHDAAWGFQKEKRGWRGFDTMLPLLAGGCRIVTEYAAAKGIRTMVENHGLFAQDSDRFEKLVNAVAHDNFGLLVDMGNFLCVDEDPVSAVSRVAPYAFHAHAKDFHVKSGSGDYPGRGFWLTTRGGNYLRGAIIGHGAVPVKQCLRILKNAGYDGYVSIEFEGIEEPETGVSIGLENLRRYIGEI